MPRKCCFEGCYKSPSFNFEGEKIPIYCVSHSKNGMVDVFSKFCAEEGCRIHPSFNYPHLGTKIGKYCSSHKLPGMVDVRSRRCQHDGCSTFPTFNYPGERPGLYCAKHRLADMGDVRQYFVTSCRHEGCDDVPCYNFPEKKGLLFCELHKSEGMVYKVKTCEFEGCTRKPTFNFDDYPTPILCADHRLVGMTYVSKRTQTCEHEGCRIFPSFNYEGVKGKRFCAAHKLPGMVEGKRRICEAEGCTLHPSFNFPGETRRRFCATHRETDMVSVGRRSDRGRRNRRKEGQQGGSDEAASRSNAEALCLTLDQITASFMSSSQREALPEKGIHSDGPRGGGLVEAGASIDETVTGQKRRVSQMEMKIGVEELMRRPAVPTMLSDSIFVQLPVVPSALMPTSSTPLLYPPPVPISRSTDTLLGAASPARIPPPEAITEGLVEKDIAPPPAPVATTELPAPEATGPPDPDTTELPASTLLYSQGVVIAKVVDTGDTSERCVDVEDAVAV